MNDSVVKQAGAAAAAEKETGRIEAFSDGVFAIAVTLLILEIKVPHLHGGDASEHGAASLAHALMALWPSYVAFLVSFATIGIMWVNHHRLFTLIQRSDHGLLLANTLLLLGITFVPFPTAVLAEHLHGEQARTGALFYSGTFVGTAVLFQVLWRHVRGPRGLLRPGIDPAAVRAIDRAYLIGLLLYVAAFALAFVSAAASVALNLALALYFALPARPARPGP